MDSQLFPVEAQKLRERCRPGTHVRIFTQHTKLPVAQRRALAHVERRTGSPVRHVVTLTDCFGGVPVYLIYVKETGASPVHQDGKV